MHVLVSALIVLLLPVAAIAQTPKDVNVLNFPPIQDVTGTVEVTNLPAEQSVTVTNTPLPV